MRVIWAYTDWTGKGDFDLVKKPLDQFALVESVLSWMYYGPEYERVFYVDRKIYRFLEKNDYLKLWDRIEIVDFQKELKEVQGVDFFAYPKIWVMTRQVEPFWICDTDLAIFRRPEEGLLDPTKIHGNLYDLPSKDIFDFFSKDFNDTTQGIEGNVIYRYAKELQDLKKIGLGNIMGSRGINGGYIYYPDPEVARIIGLSLFSIARLISSSLNYLDSQLEWMLWEEISLYGIMKALGQTPEQIKIREGNSGTYHIGLTECTPEEIKARIEDVKRTVKKVNALEWYPDLETIING